MAGSVDILPGFSDPVIASQQVFRAILDAMARPGRIGAIAEPLEPPAALSVGSAAVLLALADHDTPLWLTPEIRDPATTTFLRFHCGSPIVDDPAEASFAVADGTTLPGLGRFALGDDAWPETSTTVIVQVGSLEAGRGLVLTGPGIESEHRLSVTGLRDDLWPEWSENRSLFPRGVDLVLVAGDRIAALPRTTDVRAED